MPAPYSLNAAPRGGASVQPGSGVPAMSRGTSPSASEKIVGTTSTRFTGLRSRTPIGIRPGHETTSGTRVRQS